ncbi:MAG: hypothetical protein MRZ09_01645 [Coprobacillus sp.]|nr:hypothetical protein [Coprobacillus sp.]MDY4144914.1 hypothetical protein [Bacilli bacterium]OLA09106.1 MAG: hypothetical protein BHW12_04620 [Coprobacillus sp. 28_7]
MKKKVFIFFEIAYINRGFINDDDRSKTSASLDVMYSLDRYSVIYVTVEGLPTKILTINKLKAFFVSNLSIFLNGFKMKIMMLIAFVLISADEITYIVMSDGTILLSHNFKVLMISYVNRLFLEKKKKIIKREKNITKTFVKKE